MCIFKNAKGASSNNIFCIMSWASAVDRSNPSTAALSKMYDCTCTTEATQYHILWSGDTVLSGVFPLALLYKMKLMESLIKGTSPKLVCN